MKLICIVNGYLTLTHNIEHGCPFPNLLPIAGQNFVSGLSRGTIRAVIKVMTFFWGLHFNFNIFLNYLDDKGQRKRPSL